MLIGLVTYCVESLLKHIIKEKTEESRKVTGRRGRRRKQLLDYLNEIREYCRFTKYALDNTMWRGCGRVVRPTSYGVMKQVAVLRIRRHFPRLLTLAMWKNTV